MSINSEAAHLHQSNSQLLLSRKRLVIQSMINLDGCYKEKFMVTWPRAYLDFGYLELPLISKRKSDPCFNIEI